MIRDTGTPLSAAFGDEIIESDRDYQIFNMTFEGFSSQQRRTVGNIINFTDLPLNNISKVVYLSNTEGKKHWLGHHNSTNHEIALYKRLETLPPIAQLGTIVHEIAHSVSPFREENASLYGDERSMRKTARHIKGVAEQSLLTNRFLNAYHAELAKALKSGEIDTQRFSEETGAILIELKFSNPNHLRQVEEAQKVRLKYLKYYGHVDLNFKFTGITSGVNETLFRLMPFFGNDKQSLDLHIANVRSSVKQGL